MASPMAKRCDGDRQRATPRARKKLEECVGSTARGRGAKPALWVIRVAGLIPPPGRRRRGRRARLAGRMRSEEQKRKPECLR
jgi:hypothetical protein